MHLPFDPAAEGFRDVPGWREGERADVDKLVFGTEGVDLGVWGWYEIEGFGEFVKTSVVFVRVACG